MPIINSQLHAYEANTAKRPWHNVPNWPDHVTGDEMVAAMNKVGVDSLAGALWRAPDPTRPPDCRWMVSEPAVRRNPVARPIQRCLSC